MAFFLHELGRVRFGNHVHVELDFLPGGDGTDGVVLLDRLPGERRQEIDLEVFHGLRGRIDDVETHLERVTVIYGLGSVTLDVHRYVTVDVLELVDGFTDAQHPFIGLVRPAPSQHGLVEVVDHDAVGVQRVRAVLGKLEVGIDKNRERNQEGGIEKCSRLSSF